LDRFSVKSALTALEKSEARSRSVGVVLVGGSDCGRSNSKEESGAGAARGGIAVVGRLDRQNSELVIDDVGGIVGPDALDGCDRQNSELSIDDVGGIVGRDDLDGCDRLNSELAIDDVGGIVGPDDPDGCGDFLR
jgi:hypothetical protein